MTCENTYEDWNVPGLLLRCQCIPRPCEFCAERMATQTSAWNIPVFICVFTCHLGNVWFLVLFLFGGLRPCGCEPPFAERGGSLSPQKSPVSLRYVGHWRFVAQSANNRPPLRLYCSDTGSTCQSTEVVLWERLSLHHKGFFPQHPGIIHIYIHIVYI